MDKSEKYWELIQAEAAKQNSVFYFYACEGRPFELDDLEGEDMSGWLLPGNLSAEFEEVWSETDKNQIDEKWQAYFTTAQWEEKQETIKITFKDIYKSDWETFSYIINREYDEDIFYKQCKALEEHIPDLIKSELVTDDENTQIQDYYLGKEKLTIYNNQENGISIISDFDIEPFFPFENKDDEEEEDE